MLLLEVIVAVGWMIFGGSIFLLILTAWLTCRVRVPSKWRAVLLPAGFALLGLFAVGAGRRITDTCIIYFVMALIMYLTNKVGLPKFIEVMVAVSSEEEQRK